MRLRPLYALAGLAIGFGSLPLSAQESPAAPATAAPATVAPAAEKLDYVRFVGDNRRGKLETVVVTMQNAAGVTVDLIGAVHIADPSYYASLMNLFAKYEVLLFELVDGQRLKEEFEMKPRRQAKPRGKTASSAPNEGAQPPKSEPKTKDGNSSSAESDDEADGGGAAFGVLRVMMQGLGNYFKLQYQTDGIDYSTKNFVHADVSMDEFIRLQSEKGESFATLFQKAFEAQFKRGPRKEEEPTGGQMLLALLGDSSGIKIAMAKMLGQAEELGAELGFGPDSVIVGERNRVALEVFDREVKSGRKHLGVFYGAAHLPDLEERLEKRGYKRTKEDWITAWDIKPAVEQKSPEKQ
jgi:hypothetical protein